MTEPANRITVRSYRTCFRVERRIYKLDRWRLPAPWGVPLRGIGYAAAALVAVLLLTRLPVLGGLLDDVHPVFRLGGVPMLAAYVLCAFEPDGRPAHRAIVARVRVRLRPRYVAAPRAVPAPGTIVRLADVTLAADERTSAYRPARVVGPARVVLRYPGRARRSGWRRRRMTITQTSATALDRGVTVTVPEGHELWVR